MATETPVAPVAPAPAGQPATAEAPASQTATAIPVPDEFGPNMKLADGDMVSLSDLTWGPEPTKADPAGQPAETTETPGQAQPPATEAQTKTETTPAAADATKTPSAEPVKSENYTALFNAMNSFQADVVALANKAPGDPKIIQEQLAKVEERLKSEADMLPLSETLDLRDQRADLQNKLAAVDQYRNQVQSFMTKANNLRKQADGYIQKSYPALFREGTADNLTLKTVVYPLLKNIPGFVNNPYDGVISAALTEVIVKADKFDKMTSTTPQSKRPPQMLESGGNPPTNAATDTTQNLFKLGREEKMSWGEIMRKIAPGQFR